MASVSLLISEFNVNKEFTPDLNINYFAKDIIRIAPTVAQPQVRAGITIESISSFDLHIRNENNAAYNYNALMKKNDGEWESFVPSTTPYLDALTLLWENKTQKVKVAAIYVPNLLPPQFRQRNWDRRGYNYAIRTRQHSEQLMRINDILYMTEKEIDPSKDLVNGQIQITLHHRLSKLNLKVKLSTEFNKLDRELPTNPILSINVNGTKVKANWKIIEDNLSAYGQPNCIIPWCSENGYTFNNCDKKQRQFNYECILLPQTVDNNSFGVSFNICERDFSWTSSKSVQLDGDRQYNLTLLVGHDVVTIESFFTTPWTEEEPQNIGSN